MSHAPTIRAAIASLTAGLPERLDAFNDDDANTVELPQIADEDIHFGPMPAGGGWRFPMIEVAVPEAVIDDFAVEQAAHTVKAPALVAAWVEGEAGNSSALYEMALGYSACILDVLLQPDAWGDGVVLERIEMSYPAFSPDPQAREAVGFRVLALHVFAFEDEGSRT